jgi:hypothetical protein
MKKVLLVFLASAIASFGMAQTFQQGNKIGQVGIGFGSPFFANGSKMGVPPVHIAGEFGFSDKIGIGGLIGFTSSKIEETFGFGFGDYSWKYSYLIVGARGSYHFYQTDKIDAYGGVMLGANIASVKFESDDPTLEQFVTEPKAGGVAFGFYGGARYYFNEKTALFAEVGYNIAWLSAGLAFKL